MTLLRIGPTLLRAKPIIFASRLSPKGQVIGGFVQSRLTARGVSIALNASGISEVIANKVIGFTLDPVTRGRIRDVASAKGAVLTAVQDLSVGRPTLQGVGDLSGVLTNPLVGPVVARQLALESGVPAWVFYFI